jgi:hypothetical protein
MHPAPWSFLKQRPENAPTMPVPAEVVWQGALGTECLKEDPANAPCPIELTPTRIV